MDSTYLIEHYWEFVISDMGCIGKCLKMKLGNLQLTLAKTYLNTDY